MFRNTRWSVEEKLVISLTLLCGAASAYVIVATVDYLVSLAVR